LAYVVGGSGHLVDRCRLRRSARGEARLMKGRPVGGSGLTFFANRRIITGQAALRREPM